VSLHYPTLGLIIGVDAIVTLMVMVMLWRINPEEKGPGLWAIAAVLGAAGAVVPWFLASYRPYDIFVTNFLVLTTNLILLEGILRFRSFGNERKRIPYIVLLILLFGVSSYLNMKNPVRRYLVHDVFQIILLMSSAVVLVHRTKHLERVIYGLTAMFFVVFSAGFMYRWILAFTGNLEITANGSHLELIYFLVIIWGLGWTFGLSISVYLRARNRIEELARLDHLTGLYNRRSLEEFFHRAVQQYKRRTADFGIGLVDINGFKQVNDEYGHNFGDEILGSFSNLLSDSTRANDTVFRLGGDEFLILLMDLNNVGGLSSAHDRILEKINSSVGMNSYRVSFAASMGSSIYPGDGTELDKLIHIADQRMFSDKKNKKLDTRIERC